MAFFLFGTSYKSWAFGNKVWTTWSDDLETSLKKQFTTGMINGNNIDWVSTGAQGQIYIPCFPKTPIFPGAGLTINRSNGATYVWRSEDPHLLADTKTVNLDAYGFRTRIVEHISFSSGGGWIVAYNDGTLRVSMTGTFTDEFHAHVAPYLITKNCSNPQQSTVKYVFFGAGNTFLVRWKDGRVTGRDAPPQLMEKVSMQLSRGFTLAKYSVLCPWDARFFFVGFEPTSQYSVAPHQYSWNIWPNGHLSDIVLREVVEGVVPASISAVTPVNMPPPRRIEDILSAHLSEEDIKGLKECFRSMETFPGSGRAVVELTAAGLEGAAKALGVHNLSTLGRFWDEVDTDESGDLDLDEFLHFMTLLVIAAYIQRLGHDYTSFLNAPANLSQLDSMLTKIALEQNLDGELSNMSLNDQSSCEGKNKPDRGEAGDESCRDADNAQLKDSLMSCIVTEKPDVKWDDVAGLESAKQELQGSVLMPIKFPELFKGQRKQRRGILLYGPPGTGKSFLAKAIATEVEATLFSVSSSDVMSKWLGESERLIKQLFQLAREKKPSIIFIDEIEALCGSRDAPDANPHLIGLKTEFLVQMDGVGNDNGGVLLLGATNLPWALDPAVRRRFQRKIHIPLPDEKARRQLFKIESAKEMQVDLKKADLIELAAKTRGFSGSDISNVLQDALDIPIKAIQQATHYRKEIYEGKELFAPCKQHENGAIKMTFMDVPSGKLKAPGVQREDIFSVLEKSKASVSGTELGKYTRWTEEFGSEGA